MIKRIALGTVQFGLRYGIANRGARVSSREAAAIIAYAWKNGVHTLDTAAGYGDSEKRLGKIGVDQWRVVSKLPPMADDVTDIERWTEECALASLNRLRIAKLYGLLLHRPRQLLGPRGQRLYRALHRLKENGKVEKIGISICGPEELDELWPHFRFDLVQGPFNVIDRRLADSGWLATLHQSGTEIHVRSAFLQGLLLMAASDRPERFHRWNPLWNLWHRWLEEEGIGALQACLGFVLSRLEVDRVVIGVDSVRHFEEVLIADIRPVTRPPLELRDDSDLIRPYRWSKL